MSPLLSWHRPDPLSVYMFGAKGIKSDQIKWNDQIKSDQIKSDWNESDQIRWTNQFLIAIKKIKKNNRWYLIIWLMLFIVQKNSMDNDKLTSVLVCARWQMNWSRSSWIKSKFTGDTLVPFDTTSLLTVAPFSILSHKQTHICCASEKNDGSSKNSTPRNLSPPSQSGTIPLSLQSANGACV